MSLILALRPTNDYFWLRGPVRYYDPTPIRLEKFPRISAQFLAREGLLSETDTVVGAYTSQFEPFLVVRQSVNKVSIVTLYDDRPRVQEVIARYMPSGTTLKPVFGCPVLGRFCEEVVLINGLWASRAGHNLPVRKRRAQRKMESQLQFRDKFLKAHMVLKISPRTVQRRLKASPHLKLYPAQCEEISTEISSYSRAVGRFDLQELDRVQPGG